MSDYFDTAMPAWASCSLSEAARHHCFLRFILSSQRNYLGEQVHRSTSITTTTATQFYPFQRNHKQFQNLADHPCMRMEQVMALLLCSTTVESATNQRMLLLYAGSTNWHLNNSFPLVLVEPRSGWCGVPNW
jgi:hypothetical protein